jgi:hypothetical protein
METIWVAFHDVRFVPSVQLHSGDTDIHSQHMILQPYSRFLRNKTMFLPPVEAVTSLCMAVGILGKFNRETQMVASSFLSGWWNYIN